MKLKQAVSFCIALAMAISLCVEIVSATNLNSDYSINCVDELTMENQRNTGNEDSDSLAAQRKAIIIVPGILGTKLCDYYSLKELWPNLLVYDKSALYLNEDGTSKNYIIPVPYDEDGPLLTYEKLRKSLIVAFSNEFDVRFFGYDWRLSNTDAALELAKLANGYDEVFFVAHSMGGLIVSKYLATSINNRSKTLGVITVGTPYVGAAKCINVMETGDLIQMPGMDNSLFAKDIKEVCKNSFAAYQLLPTSKYFTYTGIAPISVGGKLYSSITPQLYNASWGKTSGGTTKVQFSAATTFHNSLYTSNGKMVIEWSDVNCYTIAGSGIDTVSRVVFTSDYQIDYLEYSNSGDGTVLQGSAGLGMPDMTYSSSGDDYEHTNLVKNQTIVDHIISQIKEMTGVVPAATIGGSGTMDCSALEEVEINRRGWLEGTDNRRINVYTDSEAQLYVDEVLIDESNEALYDSNGIRIGTVWQLGNTGRKMYALYSNDYTVVTTGDSKVEYMNNGYYDKIIEYSCGDDLVSFSVGKYEDKTVKCESASSYIMHNRNDNNEIQPLHIYTEYELAQRNRD